MPSTAELPRGDGGIDELMTSEVCAAPTEEDDEGKWDKAYGEGEGGGARPFLKQNKEEEKDQAHCMGSFQLVEDGEEKEGYEGAMLEDEESCVHTDGPESATCEGDGSDTGLLKE